ncbi:MAG: ABC transporter ATP-binding protein [Candidatus Neomarinimicrobiota bacterium]|nr:MAG: ABC transporter ATP-binding protein [Candidatus Neomarinimicrobiota bacterium]
MAKSKKEIISIQSVSKIYNLGETVVKALDNVSLSIYDNDYISIMGPSGSGKSTLMNIIGCLDVPTKGKYKFKDELISEMDDNQLANIRNEKIGFVFQTFNLLPKLNAMQNVEVPLIYSSLGRKERIERAEEALHIVGLQDRMTHKPNELSGGQRQRVAIARALVNKPSIILADEPTGNLDSKSGNEILKFFAKLHKDGNTIIMVTHEESVAKLSKRRIDIFDGKIARDE